MEQALQHYLLVGYRGMDTEVLIQSVHTLSWELLK